VFAFLEAMHEADESPRYRPSAFDLVSTTSAKSRDLNLEDYH